MSQWDTSALVKLYAMEADSAQFQGLAAPGVPLAVARIAHYEAHAAFRRRGAEGALPPGETAILLREISADIRAEAIRAANATSSWTSHRKRSRKGESAHE